MKTNRYLIDFIIGLLIMALLAACNPTATPSNSAGTTTAVPPTATTEANSAGQQAAATVNRFLQSLLDDPTGPSSLSDLSEPLRADVESSRSVTTSLGIDNMYRSFGVETVEVDANKGQAIVTAGLNYVSPVKRDFILIKENGNWLINTIISYSMPAMSLPQDRLASDQVIIDYYQALGDRQITDAMALLASSEQTNEADIATAAQEIQKITTIKLDLLQASPDKEVYAATF